MVMVDRDIMVDAHRTIMIAELEKDTGAASAGNAGVLACTSNLEELIDSSPSNKL